MTDVESTAHAIYSHMSIHLRDAFRTWARTGKVSKEGLASFQARALIRNDEYKSPVLTMLGTATLKHIEKGIYP